jgi:hypothetical protein
MKKWRRGKGTMLTASLRRSELSWPGKRSDVVMPDMTSETSLFSSPYAGFLSFSVRKQMSYLHHTIISTGKYNNHARTTEIYTGPKTV